MFLPAYHAMRNRIGRRRLQGCPICAQVVKCTLRRLTNIIVFLYTAAYCTRSLLSHIYLCLIMPNTLEPGPLGRTMSNEEQRSFLPEWVRRARETGTKLDLYDSSGSIVKENDDKLPV